MLQSFTTRMHRDEGAKPLAVFGSNRRANLMSQPQEAGQVAE